jgi:uncharacterized membrane protein YedE/YeeE
LLPNKIFLSVLHYSHYIWEKYLTMDLILAPWPWYVGGPAIAVVLFLLLFSEKRFGMSTNLKTMCSMAGAGKKIPFFAGDWKANRWGLLVALGAAVGGFIAATYMTNGSVGMIHPDVVTELNQMGISGAGVEFMPPELFGIEALTQPKTLVLLALGGFLIGFGTRYAGGCTSGHAISGLSDLQWPSLVAVIGFFVGGLLMNHLILPYIL